MNKPVIAMVMAGAFVLAGGWLIKAWVRFRTDRLVEVIMKNAKKSDPRVLEDPKNGSLVADEVGFKLGMSNGASVEFFWKDIEEIRAFKKDLLTTDLICLGLKKSGDDDYYVIHEEMAGYYDLLQMMEKCLPKFDITWVLDVAFPAFATNHRVIWKRIDAVESDVEIVRK